MISFETYDTYDIHVATFPCYDRFEKIFGRFGRILTEWKTGFIFTSDYGVIDLLSPEFWKALYFKSRYKCIYHMRMGWNK